MPKITHYPLFNSFLTSLLEISLLTTAIYLAGRTGIFTRFLFYRASLADKIKGFVFFAILSLLEDLFPHRGPNSSIIAATGAGLLMGSVMGLGVGLWTWALLLLRYHALWNSGVGAILAGFTAGWVYSYHPAPQERQVAGFLVGLLGQAIWLTIELFTTNFSIFASWDAMVLFFAPPMLGGGIGVLVFLWILEDLRLQQEKIARQQIARALEIANRTLPYLRQGLTPTSARSIARIIKDITGVAAVAFSDQQHYLAFVGAGEDHHHPGEETLIKPEPTSPSSTGNRVHCPVMNCPLSSAFINPLFHQGKIIGYVHLYEAEGRPFGEDALSLGIGLAEFFSRYQMELAELELQTQAVAQAELKALQSQVHPHFLFNVLNTLTALCELDPPRASRMIVRLGYFLRRSLRENPPALIPLREELENVQAYLEIEQARFGERLRIEQEIGSETYSLLIPSFGLQILVENAILHGTSKKVGGGRVQIKVKQRGPWLQVRVGDNGVGFDWQKVKSSPSSRPSGLRVLQERCHRIYQGRFRFRVLSKPGQGTAVFWWVPAWKVEEDTAKHLPQLSRIEEG